MCVSIMEESSKSNGVKKFRFLGSRKPRSDWPNELAMKPRGGAGNRVVNHEARAAKAASWRERRCCFKCGLQGHIVIDCPGRERDEESKVELRSSCERIRERSSRRGRKGVCGIGSISSSGWRHEGSRKYRRRERRSFGWCEYGEHHRRRFFRGRCFVCEKPGHKAKECWHRHRGGPERRHEKMDTAASCEEGQQAVALMALDPGAEHVNKVSELSWILDTRICSHAVGSSEYLTDIQWGKAKVHVRGEILESIGVGRIRGRVKTEDAGRTMGISFEEVHLVPKLEGNRLSVNKIIDRGGSVEFGPGGGLIKVKGKSLPMYAIDGMIILKQQFGMRGVHVKAAAG